MSENPIDEEAARMANLMRFVFNRPEGLAALSQLHAEADMNHEIEYKLAMSGEPIDTHAAMFRLGMRTAYIRIQQWMGTGDPNDGGDASLGLDPAHTGS